MGEGKYLSTFHDSAHYEENEKCDGIKRVKIVWMRTNNVIFKSEHWKLPQITDTK